LAPLIDLVHQQLDPQAISQLSQQLGTDENTTRQAVPAALTALLGGLSQNASQPQGAQQLAGALSRDHDGSLLDNLSGFFGNPQGGQGAGILGHIFGNRTPKVESQVGRTTGLNQQQVARLLMLLAPVVLAALSRRQQQQQQQGGLNPGGINTGGFNPGGLSDILRGEREHIERTNPQNRGLLESILDRDGDGQVMDDIAGMAGGILGGGRR
jgi:hypothetical protein